VAQRGLESVEFNESPSVLIFADGASARARAVRTAELAGCRVSDVAGIGGAVERLGRQAGLGAAFLELEREDRDALPQLLEAIEKAASDGSHGSVVSAPPELIDLIAAKTSHPRVIHLCEADEYQRAAAVAEASARRKHRLHDIGQEQEPPQLQQLSEEVGRIANILASLSQAQSDQPHAEADNERGIVDAGQVRAIIRARRLRDQYFGAELFADPAWDILLDLFAAQLEKRKVAVSSLCIAAAVPPTTALRWIKTLTDLGLLVRAADPQDRRRVYIELAPKTAERVEACLSAALRVSPPII
jgi:hypothetical protein